MHAWAPCHRLHASAPARGDSVYSNSVAAFRLEPSCQRFCIPMSNMTLCGLRTVKKTWLAPFLFGIWPRLGGQRLVNARSINFSQTGSNIDSAFANKRMTPSIGVRDNRSHPQARFFKSTRMPKRTRLCPA